MASEPTAEAAPEAADKPATKKAPAKKAAGKKAAAKKASGKTGAAKKADGKKASSKGAPVKKAAKKKAKKKATKAKASVAGQKSGRKLVIVESPAKARTIKKYLGKGYTVKASVGHVKDLPKSKLSVDIDNDFLPNYEIIRGKAKIIKEIKEAAYGVDAVYLAPDPDREGEAIAWHLYEELGKRHQKHTHRITFNEITKKAVQAALLEPRPINTDKFEAQQARRILDRIVGYQISPILWDKVRRGLSAGRVQSVAVRLIVEREAEIKAFDAEEYWVIECLLAGDKPPPFLAKVIKGPDGEKFRPDNKADADTAVHALSKAEFIVDEVKRRERRRRPLAPFITSKLQQEAAGRLRFTAKRTMMVAQQLYEGVELGDEGAVALITYMRTDSTRVSDDALTDLRTHIGARFGPEYLPAEPNAYKMKKGAQDAHEAIRPTSLDYPPEKVAKFLSKDQNKLYRLIWNWFVASQMVPAVYDQTTVDIKAGEYALRATGSIMKFPGFLAAHGVADEVDEETGEVEDKGHEAKEGELPEVEEADKLTNQKTDPQQKFTQPPPRFSESSLVKELEDDGIGRPSTYASILSTVVTRNYVTKDDGRFRPTELGTLITELLVVSFPQIVDVAFTAAMEEKLDEVEEGKVDWHELLGDFYHNGFKQSLETAKTEMRDVKREETPTEHVCEKCGSDVVIKWGRNGSFLACMGYPTCRFTRDYERRDDGTVEILPEETTTELCPTCSGPMVVKTGRYGKFYACVAYPDCKGTRPVSIGMACPNECGGYAVERRSHRGRIFYGCSSWPKCEFASWQRPMPGPCPTCGSKYLIRKYTKRDGLMINCPDKECTYTRDPELDDDDVKAVTGAA